MARRKNDIERVGKNIVTKHNDFVRYKKLKETPLTLTEKKLVNYAISALTLEDLQGSQFPLQVFKLSEFCEAIGIKRDGASRAINKTTFSILGKPFEIIRPSFNGEKPKIAQCNWFTRCDYDPEDSTLTIRFHESLIPFVLQLKGEYTTYRIEEILRMKNLYSPDWYEFFKSYMSLKSDHEMTIDEIRRLLVVQDKYKKDIEVIRNCVRKPIEEINKKTDIFVEIEEVKQGNKIVSIKFYFRHKQWRELLDSKSGFIDQLEVEC
jgi:plasmid replication initiation protein